MAEAASFTAEQAAVGERWSAVPTRRRYRWWHSDRIKRHVNRRVAGLDEARLHAGFHRLLKAKGPFGRAISVGSGFGSKEIALLSAGIVEAFDCYEFSASRIEAGEASAKKLGLEGRIAFHRADAFAGVTGETFDLVYWNNSLHHMMDAEKAIRWSHERLQSGGCFAMDDFVGPTGFQWDPVHLRYVNEFLATLPDRVFANARQPAAPFSRRVKAPNIGRLWAKDPSEAADSGRILPSLKAIFPSAEIILTGGAIYHTALKNVIENIDEVNDRDMLEKSLSLDDQLIKLGFSNYAVALARKS
jgi:SAM-dependent methyltransferase